MARFPKLTGLILGLASATGFAPWSLWPVTLLCLAGLMHSVDIAPDRRAALARAYWFGVGHFVVGLNWIAGSFRYQDAMPVWLGWVAVVTLSLYLAVYPALAAGLAWRFGRARAAAFVLFFAAAWIATEWLRGTMFTGFAWNPLSVSLIPAGLLPASTRWIGTYGASGLMLVMAGGLWLIARRQWLAGLACAAPLAFCVPTLPLPQNSDRSNRPLLHIVQPNIGQEMRNNPNEESIRFQRLEALSGFAGATPRLILWPEASAPGFIETEEWNRARVAQILGPRDILLTGADTLVYDKSDTLIGAHNAMVVVTPEGELLHRYDKSHLVPYGEYLALRWLLEPLGATRLVPGDIDFLPGPGPQSFAIPGFAKVGTQICYEIVFSGQVVDRRNRPDFLFNPSNDAWFGLWGPPQHLAQAQLRAIEEGLPIVRSTPTGISAIIDANGRIVKAIPYQKAGSITARLPSARAPTLFSRHGNILPFAFAFFLTVIGIALRVSAR